jgi:hypothetical protein
MSGTRTAMVAFLVALAAFLLVAAPASAEFGPIQLVSKTIPEPAKEATAPAINADGNYVAFQGSMDEGRVGVFRADLETGVVVPVATGAPDEVPPPGSAAEAPSISADGRYVSFTTKAPLDPADDTQASSADVYVADMSASPPTYELASAQDGSSQAMSGGSKASPRVALSADGRKIVFVNGGQVYLRDLDTKRTTLVSVRRNPESGVMEPGVPVPGGAVMRKEQQPGLTGAALSADGTTVAWMGAHLPEQVPLLADEAEAIALDDAGNRPYAEPLWRRIADGPLAPTRRIIGGGDPLAPGCPGTAGTLAESACRGPFPTIATKSDLLNVTTGWLGVPGHVPIDGVPQLSADGYTAALIGNPTEATNVFVVDMHAGLSRTQAVRQLTAQIPLGGDESGQINSAKYVPINGHVYDLAISADGRQIVLATGRERFPLAPPNLVSRPPTQLGLVELYLIDLETESLQRITHGYRDEAEPSLGGAGERAELGNGAYSPSLGAGDHRIAFSSTASNLVEGDGNEASDVFLLEGDVGSAPAGGSSISAGPGKAAPKGRRRLTLTAFSLPDGRVRLAVTAPAAGTLRALVSASLEVGSRPRRLTEGHARTRPSGAASMTLTLPPRYRHLARSDEGLYATARVSFTPARGARLRGRPLRGELQVRFHAHRRRSGDRR